MCGDNWGEQYPRLQLTVVDIYIINSHKFARKDTWRRSKWLYGLRKSQPKIYPWQTYPPPREVVAMLDNNNDDNNNNNNNDNNNNE